jgi:4'-phosphopantetheinyl transferase
MTPGENSQVRMPLASSLSAAWSVPSQAPQLNNGEVHVWSAALDQTPSQIDSFLRTLSADERARAKKFVFPRDRGHFIAGRGALRAIVGLYLNRAPECVSFRYNSHGKPALMLESGEEPIRFNMSHSQGVALYAIACDREIGIDLECVRSNLEVEQIAERFFSSHEIVALRALPVALREYAFFLCWTRKEAYVKARGEGLSLPLDQFDVSLVPGEPAALLRTRPDPDEALRWSLRELTLVPPGYAGALAVEGDDWSLVSWEWPGSLSEPHRISK